MGRERPVTRFAADARVRVVRTRIRNVGVALDTGALTRVDDRARGDLHERPGAVTAEPPVICRDEQRSEHGEHDGNCREYSGKSQQVFVRSKRRHDARVVGKRGAGHDAGTCLDFFAVRASGCELLNGGAQK